jgi:hypothetical protein
VKVALDSLKVLSPFSLFQNNRKENERRKNKKLVIMLVSIQGHQKKNNKLLQTS